VTDLADLDGSTGSPPRRRRLATKFQVGLVVANLLFWGGIFVWSVTVDEDAIDEPDHLDDPAFGAAAEPICARAVADLEAGDLLHPSPDSPADRADTVDESNRILRAMVLDLGAVDRPAGTEGEWVTRWLEDWDQHIADRQAWADRLRAGDDGPFAESERGGEQLSRVIDNFAEVNDMPSCTTTHDV
jgi:hypothetical protein